ncbi:MAG: hypothetical protein JW717_10310 [Marinilabiliaceae bacterium]|nr:hypothetical protein [Marinilabiliaceae bacterium]
MNLVQKKLWDIINSSVNNTNFFQDVNNIGAFLHEELSPIIDLSISLKIESYEWTNKKINNYSFHLKQILKDESDYLGYLNFYIYEAKNKEFIADLQQFQKIFSEIIEAYYIKNKYKKLKEQYSERLKELQGINHATKVLNQSKTLFEALQQICNSLPSAFQFPTQTTVRIIYEDNYFQSSNFVVTNWVLNQLFTTPDLKEGSIEVYFSPKELSNNKEPFLKEEKDLIDNLAALISGSASREGLRDLLLFNTERLKELKGISKTVSILSTSKSIEDAAEKICNILPASWQYPADSLIRITYGKQIFCNNSFKESPWKMEEPIKIQGRKKGAIEVFYSKEFPKSDEGPFLKEERQLLINISHIISGFITRKEFDKLHRQNIERVKELNAINKTTNIVKQLKPVSETLKEICSILPQSWQYPKHTAVRITFEEEQYYSEPFVPTKWVQKEPFATIDNKKGFIEVFYLKPFPNAYEGPFLKEERKLLINICRLITGFLNSAKGREIIHRKTPTTEQNHKTEEFRKSLVTNKKPLQLYFNQQIIEKYIYLDMMKYKIKHILFVATLYDAFILENEDSFFERFMGEIYQYSLFSLPRITGVSSSEEALELLKTTHFDLVILMVGIDREAPILLSEKIKEANINLPIYLLLNKKSDVKYFENIIPLKKSIDNLFVWNGDSVILFSIVKSIEDSVNVENDTKIGLVRVILLIEDSPIYYSKYLQILYSIVFGQVQKLLPEVEKNEIDKIAKMRSRPKVLHARNFEEAVTIFNTYKDYLICIISDIEFEWAGKYEHKAGLHLLNYIRSHASTVPIIIQSTKEINAKEIRDNGAFFINKNSETLLNDLKKYLIRYLGFGDFTFRDQKGKVLGVAKSLREFELLIQQVPDESIMLHAAENQFSLWLMARGEIQLAKTLNPMKLDKIEQVQEVRQQLLNAIIAYKSEKKKGKVLSYNETATIDERNIISFANGSLGGKGRGLAFIDILIYNLNDSNLSKKINIITPITVIIGTDEFQKFIKHNNLYEKIVDKDISYDELRVHFYNGKLTNSLLEKLKVFVNHINKPIIVRSSSSSEDSISQPFAGVFDSYIVPNNCYQKDEAFKLICDAVKLVFASVYSDMARNYFKSIHHKIEEEKMAVVIQELVGHQFDDYYYPHISGVAQSYNFYPVADMKPEEGFAVAALGLGSYVVNGWKAYRFAPNYPKISMYNTKDLLKNTQTQFYALDCKISDIDFLKNGELAALKLLDVYDAEKHGSLQHLVSIYDYNNDSFQPGLTGTGAYILNFANILLYNYFPLAETISLILNTVKEAFGSPVEIEYAVDLTPGLNGLPSFYLLQIKPMVETHLKLQQEINTLDKEKMLLYSKSSLGNGEIKDITDVIYVDTDKFNKLKTIQMVQEIEYLNNKMINNNQHYLLIGPGRWGSSDRFLGIPVDWSQISNAKVIVEISMENYPLDFSLGSHFFHNITSMNIGYLAIQGIIKDEFIKWEKIYTATLIQETDNFKHVRFEKPLSIYLDGKNKETAIIINN